MSGHNKWSQIKEKKAKTDSARAKVFSKYAKIISVEALKAKGDRTSPNLRAAIDRAKAENVPSDIIDRAVKKATEAGGQAIELISYEAYGPGGCALIIEALTGNKNKAAQEVKHILSENGFSLAAPGSASWVFRREGIKWIPTSTIPLEDNDIIALEKLVDALDRSDEVQEVFTNVE